jgi:hypothetical protein
MKYLLNFNSYKINENLNTSSIRESLEKGLDNLKNQIRDVCVENTLPEYKNLVKIGYNRVVGKLLPLIKPYLIPTIKVNGKVILQEKKTEPEQFFSEIWPKFWDSFTALERGIIKKYTTLSRETTYEEIIDGAKSSMSEFGFDRFDEQFFTMIKNTYKDSLSGIDTTNNITISIHLLDKINKDLGNSDDDTDYVDNQKNMNVKPTSVRDSSLNTTKDDEMVDNDS